MSATPQNDAGESASYSSSFLREMLLSLRLVSGEEYPALLHEAGLDAYQDALPPATRELVATPAMITRLFNVGYSHLPPPQAMLFFNNMGEHLARLTWEQPTVQALAAEVRAAPPVEQVATAWRRLIGIISQDAALRRQVSSDERNDYLILQDCPYCRAIHDAPRPVCFTTVRYYEVLFQQILGHPVIVREVECFATGHARCMFAVRRDRPVAKFS